MKWDPGPPDNIATIFENAPLELYIAKPGRFRLPWGPIFYRGRLDGSAKILLIGQDPAADENVARRILVGDAGQRVQGYLAKLGITRSYIMINSFLFSITGQFDNEMMAFSDIPAIVDWRNMLIDTLVTDKVKVILTFGVAARHIVDSWPRAAEFKNNSRLFNLMHPTARPASKVLSDWNNKLGEIAVKVTDDQDGNKDLTPYGSDFVPQDLTRIPLYDFPFGVPSWVGTGDMAKRKTITGKVGILWTALSDVG